jgi:hypothetical protein
MAFAGGHFILAAMGGTTVFAAYWILVGLAAATAAAWWPREDIDARQ